MSEDSATTPPSPQAARRLHHSRPYGIALGLLWGLPALVAGILWLVSPDKNVNGQCEGLGFGCAPTPRDTVELLSVLGAPFLLLTGLLAVCIIALIRSRRDA